MSKNINISVSNELYELLQETDLIPDISKVCAKAIREELVRAWAKREQDKLESTLEN